MDNPLADLFENRTTPGQRADGYNYSPNETRLHFSGELDQPLDQHLRISVVKIGFLGSEGSRHQTDVSGHPIIADDPVPDP